MSEVMSQLTVANSYSGTMPRQSVTSFTKNKVVYALLLESGFLSSRLTLTISNRGTGAVVGAVETYGL
jgi:hypothetical protein